MTRLGESDFWTDVARLRSVLPGQSQIIAETELADAAASIAFSSIPAGFRRLILIVEARTDRADEADGVLVQFNSDGGSNYDYIRFYASSATAATVSAARATTSIMIGQAEAASSRASNWAPCEATIHDYAATDREKWISTSTTGRMGNVSADADIVFGFQQGRWRSTAAITSITIIPQIGPNFVAGTRATLYGVL